MPAELWRPSLDLALHRNRSRPESRLVQLATVRPDSRPAIRTVVFRGFLDGSHKLLFATDVRSAKRAEIEANPHGAICWYFHGTREQFRLSGLVSLVDAETAEHDLREVRTDLWRQLSDDSRIGYTWPTPGEPRHPSVRYPSTPPDLSQPADAFGLMILAPTEVDHLELHGSPQHRWKYEADARGRWSGREVNP